VTEPFGTWSVLLAGFAAGLVLGLVFFIGLWFTVRAIARSRRPGALMAASAIGRIVVAVAGFTVIALTAGWRGVLAGLVGFIVARLATMRAVAGAGRRGTDHDAGGGRRAMDVDTGGDARAVDSDLIEHQLTDGERRGHHS